MPAIIDNAAPEPEIECWAQGYEPPINELTGQVVLIEGLKVFALATAFEHFEHNTLNKLI